MNQPPTNNHSGKRIVSKGEYVNIQVERAGIGVFGLVCFAVSGVCALVAISILAALVYGLGHQGDNSWFSGHTTHDEIIGCVIEIAVFIALACWAGKYGYGRVKMAANINPGVPLTRANTADLPAPESLVRASEEPHQEQENTLLRAAAENAHTPPEQLVRAVER